jgi:hypothetical protein
MVMTLSFVVLASASWGCQRSAWAGVDVLDGHVGEDRQQVRIDRRAGRSEYRASAPRSGSTRAIRTLGHTHGNLPVCLDEYVFRHNRGHTPMAAFQALLGLGALHGPTTYRQITTHDRAA